MFWRKGQGEQIRRGGELLSHSGAAFRWRIRFLCWREQSFFLNLRRRIWNQLGCATVGSVGIWWMLQGVFCLLLGWGRGSLKPTSSDLLLPFLMIASSLPLLGSRRAIGCAIRESRLLRGLVSLCGVLPEALAGRERGRDRRWWALLFGVLGGALAAFTSPWWLLLLLFGILLSHLIFSSPELLFLTLPAIFPFLRLTGRSTLALLSLLLLGMLSWLWRVAGGRRSLGIGKSERLLLLLAVLYLLSSAVPLAGRGRLADGLARALLLVGAFPYSGMLGSPSRRRLCVRAIVLGAGACSLIGVLQYLSGRAELLWIDTARFGTIGGRVTAAFQNPNILAVYLLLCFPFALACAMDPAQPLAWRLVGGGSFVLTLACLLLTWSRGAWLGALLGLLLFLLFYSAASRRIAMLVPLLLAAITPWLPRMILERWQSIGNPADTSASYRIYTWKGVGRMLQAHPFGIGVGETVFCKVFPSYAISGTERVMHAHSLVLGIWCEVGILGVLLLALALALGIRRGLGLLWSDPEGVRAIRIASLAALGGVLVMGMFDWIWYHTGMIFFTGLVLAMGNTGEEGRYVYA